MRVVVAPNGPPVDAAYHDAMADSGSVPFWRWRPATRAAVVGAWTLLLVVSWGAALVAGLGVGLLTYLTADHSSGSSDLAWLVYGGGTFMVVSYAMLIAAAPLLARRYVPPGRRSSGWVLAFTAFVVLATAAGVVGLVMVEQFVLVIGGTVVAVGVPVLVAPRVPLTLGD